MNKSGLTLIELMVVVALLGIIAAFAIPKLVESKKSVNENSAVSALRTLSTAQEYYNTRFGQYGSLSGLADASLIDPEFGDASTADSAKSGFYFILTLPSGGSTWSCVARPAGWGSSGGRNFMINQKGVIYWNESENSNDWSKALGQQ